MSQNQRNIHWKTLQSTTAFAPVVAVQRTAFLSRASGCSAQRRVRYRHGWKCARSRGISPQSRMALCSRIILHVKQIPRIQFFSRETLIKLCSLLLVRFVHTDTWSIIHRKNKSAPISTALVHAFKYATAAILSGKAVFARSLGNSMMEALPVDQSFLDDNTGHSTRDSYLYTMKTLLSNEMNSNCIGVGDTAYALLASGLINRDIELCSRRDEVKYGRSMDVMVREIEERRSGKIIALVPEQIHVPLPNVGEAAFLRMKNVIGSDICCFVKAIDVVEHCFFLQLSPSIESALISIREQEFIGTKLEVHFPHVQQ